MSFQSHSPRRFWEASAQSPLGAYGSWRRIDLMGYRRGPLQVLDTGLGNCGGFTTRRSHGSWSRTRSAVFPIKRRLRPERGTAPMTTMSACVRRAASLIAAAGDSPMR